MAVHKKDDWHDPVFSATWDRNPRSQFNIRDQQTDIIVSIIKDGYRTGASILDLGMGSGLLEESLFKNIPNAYVVGVDNSEPMIKIADERLLDYRNQYSIVKHDLSDLSSIDLPTNSFQYIISSQVIHELPHKSKIGVFTFSQHYLENGGTLLITDRVRMKTSILLQSYRAIWSLWAKHSPHNQDRTFTEFHNGYRQKEDYTPELSDIFGWLKDAGFDSALLFFMLNRFVIGAQKPPITLEHLQ